jgi:hypothetical protein
MPKINTKTSSDEKTVFTFCKKWRLTSFTMPEPFLAIIPYLALVTRVWMGANMMHGYPKLKNMKDS